MVVFRYPKMVAGSNPGGYSGVIRLMGGVNLKSGRAIVGYGNRKRRAGAMAW